MHGNSPVSKLLVAFLIAVLLSPSLPAVTSGEGKPSDDPALPVPCDIRGLVPHLGCEAWAVRWDGPYSSNGPIDTDEREDTTGLAASSDGELIVVTGRTPRSPDLYDGVAVALDGQTGEPLWNHRFEGPSGVRGFVWEPAISPDAGTVYLAGEGDDGQDEHTAILKAVDAETGAVTWEYIYQDEGSIHLFYDLALSPDGSKVFAIGPSQNRILTVALDTSDGSLLWKDLYDHPDTALRANHVVVGPDGEQVAIAGWAIDTEDGAIVRVQEASTGDRIWMRSLPEVNGDLPVGFQFSADGARLFLTKQPGFVTPGQQVYAFDAATGEILWSHKFIASDVAIDPEGELIYVTRGRSHAINQLLGLYLGNNPTREAAFVTVAFDQGTGEEVWRSIYEPASPVDAQALDLRVSPDGQCIYAAGNNGQNSDRDAIVHVMDAGTGDGLWTARYDGPLHDSDNVYVGVVAEETGDLFVAGETDGEYRQGDDILVLKYNDPCPLS